jgi:nitrite reductase/ring-hydroxylating ferredoxin subunit
MSIGGTMSKDVSEALIGSAAGHATALRALASIVPGGFAECEGQVNGEMDSIILHRDDADGVRAWLNICPHAGRRLDWAPGQFLKAKDGQLVCAVHGATFETVGGACTAGPCRGESLRAVAVVVRDGIVHLAG